MEIISIEKLKSNDLNLYKKDNSFFFLKKSVIQYGQLRPIIVNGDNEIIDGHKLYEVCKSLNFSEVEIKRVSCKNKVQLYCELNFPISEVNHILFYKYLKSDIDIENNNLPFDKIKLKNLLSIFNFDWNNFGKEIKRKTLSFKR